MTADPETRRLADCYAEINARLRAIQAERVPSLCGPCGGAVYVGFYERTEYFPRMCGVRESWGAAAGGEVVMPDAPQYVTYGRGELTKVEDGYDWHVTVAGFPWLIEIRRDGNRIVGKVQCEVIKPGQIAQPETCNP